jgi:hypothetical protein
VRKITWSLAAATACSALAFYAHTQARPVLPQHGLPLRAASADRLAASRLGDLPKVIFWAWERPEDLRFLNPQESGVAFLAKTIILSPSRETTLPLPPTFLVRPRLQPLRVPRGTPLIAVVRIETTATYRAATTSATHAADPAITPDARESISSEIAALQDNPLVRAVQIDFDATTSQHTFYSALLQDIRHKLPDEIPLSITALASWCIGDPWLTKLPPGTIDEAIPMLFRMGPNTAQVAAFLRSGREFGVTACRNTLGVSTDEPLSHALLIGQLTGMKPASRQKRIYVFAPHAWTPVAANSILQEWKQ